MHFNDEFVTQASQGKNVCVCTHALFRPTQQACSTLCRHWVQKQTLERGGEHSGGSSWLLC